MATIESAATVGIPTTIGSPGSPRQGITVHYVGASQVPHGAHTQCRSQVRGWHSYHLGLGWAGLGYHYVVCPHGIVLTGRGLNRIGSHSPGVNATRIGVLFMVGGNQQPPANMLRAFLELRTWLAARGVNSSSITGHQAHIATSCPGTPLMSRVRSGDWGTGGTSNPSPEGDFPLLGLKEGDGIPTPSEGVKAVQRLIVAAGFGSELEPFGVDGQWGAGTSAGLLAARRYVGSNLTSVKSMTGESYAQLIRACARREAERAANRIEVPECTCFGDGGGLPATATISGTVHLKP
ncbi:N-acetylmuramoyl-L-alanine amidase [Nocardiopsis eucommiae]|uniref:N-acetylmuramoyl-L-alanine amidase n=1 Tax=Nocardiopsis eucommiae TaxID=2831970 RepID=A0A975L751_9ACTN|nr:N-acetylmuramoyl-L-alanine amidase [Nocardiopsis eucommiae]